MNPSSVFWKRIIAGILVLSCLILVWIGTSDQLSWSLTPVRDDASELRAIRFDTNPIIRPGMPGLVGDNINGPSLIRAPSWVAQPLGRFYLYFADHKGDHIRMAYADDLRGPWTVLPGGVLRLDQTSARDHIASPDVHVDTEKREIRMYFHGVASEGEKQLTWLATSDDGLNFNAGTEPLGPFYFRVFRYDDWYYAIAKDGDWGGVLLRSRDGLTDFERGPRFVRGMRHSAVRVEGDDLLLFFSRAGDRPERILWSRIDLRDDWLRWEANMSTPRTLLAPEMDYEGIAYPLEASRSGKAVNVRQLRDPAIFVDEAAAWLLYSVAGETGIGGARLIRDEHSGSGAGGTQSMPSVR